jgi:DNA-binding CsgD family transcriptional regulator
MKPRDPIGVVETAYQLGGTDLDWLQRLQTAASSELDAGFGVLASIINIGPRGQFSAAITASEKCHDSFIAATNVAMADADWRRVCAPWLEELSLYCGTMSDSFSGYFQKCRAARDVLFPNHIRDIFCVIAPDPTGVACTISAGLPAETRLSARTVYRWSQIAAHVAAGFRVRRALVDSADLFATADAVLRPDGTCVHAEAQAATKTVRDRLRHSARDLGRARGRLRRADPDEALAIWRGLCAGRWTLVDHVDKDGRRFLLARRNDPIVRRLDPLTLPERQVAAYAALGHSNKLIAYELGLGETAVAMRLSRAARKLGASTRVQLIRHARERLLGASASGKD